MLRHGLTWVAIFGVIALMFLKLPPMVAKQDVVINTYSALVEVDALAKQKYVEAVDGRKLVDGAVRGMVLQLDPYSGYVSPTELAAFERRSAGKYIGVGIELGIKHDRLSVIAPIEDSPAAHAGIMAGDTLLSIDKRDTKDLSVFEAEDRMVGEPGTSVALEIAREGQDEPQVFQVKRGPVSVRTVRGLKRDEDEEWDFWLDRPNLIAYMRVSNFRENTMRDFDLAFNELLDQGMKGLIIDLRFNPGGLMDSAIEMVDHFIGEGPILSTVTRRRVVHEYKAKSEGTIRDLPLVILVNGSSASSSEIVAGSLQDHRRAIIVGERTFGKGSVQHLIPLTDHKAAVKLTVAYYCLPSGRIIHRTARNHEKGEWGVRPDVEVILTDFETKAIQRSRRDLDTVFRDSNLTAGTRCPPEGVEGGPPGESSMRNAERLAGANEKTSQSAREVVRDRQLCEAIRVMKEQLHIPNREF